MKVGKAGVDDDSFSAAVDQGVCNNFSASDFANELKFQGDRVCLLVLNNCGYSNSKGWTCSHREYSSTAYCLVKHVTAPSNIVIGEHSKNSNPQHPSNMPSPALLHLPATSKVL